MDSEKVMLFIASVAVAVSIVAAGVTYNSIVSLRDAWITGFLTANGTLNITIATNANVNFTNNTINWGSGFVNPAALRANLTTSRSGATITGGTWAITAFNGSQGFVVENIGNVNVSLKLMTSDTAASLLGGTSPYYMYNVTEIEAGTCQNSTGGTFTNSSMGATSGMYGLNLSFNTNTTTPGDPVCGRFQFVDTVDEIRIDVHLSVPYDAPTGSPSDYFTLTFASV